MNINQYWGETYGAVIAYGPKVLAAIAILLVAYFVGKALSKGVKLLIGRTSLGRDSAAAGQDLGASIGSALFWITLLVAFPAALGVLGLEGLLAPMQTMVAEILGFLPNLIAAGLILGIGWVIATVARRAVTTTLQAVQADKLAERFGIAEVTGQSGVSNFSGGLVFTLLIIPVAIAALDALEIQSIAEPAKLMLQSILNAIPRIFAAAIVLLLAFIIGRFASNTLATLLPATGLDTVGERVGVSRELFSDTPLSKIAGYLAFMAIMVFGLIEAAKLLDFAILSAMLLTILELGGQILLGSVIIVAGVVIADFVGELVEKSKDASPAAPLLRIAIIVLASAMGLRQMGVANEIITLGFALMIGGLAIGMAIAIGWGGKDTASRLLEKWTKDL